MFRIRLHGRGGQGMKTAAQILGRAFFLAGFEVQDAPRYGAERRGAPIFAYVRAARAAIKERGVITWPDLVIVADESLVPVPAAGVLQGLTPRTVFLINSTETAAVWQERLKLSGPALTLPAGEGITERVDLPHIGAICAGAAARLIGAVGREQLAEAMRVELAGLGEVVAEKNLTQALAAYDAMASHEGCVAEGTQIAARDYARPAWTDLPLEAAALAAPDIHAALTSELANTGVWRTLRPVIDYAHCNRCAWVCSTLCPDGAIRVDPDHTPRIDYDHCKGCMVCVAVCPPHAVRATDEREMQA
jgi:pyruvate ferredoxin oxidoreductase gamma subunit